MLSALNGNICWVSIMRCMIERIDTLTAARVDATLILLPLIGWLEASYTLAANDVPAHVAARVLSAPSARRRINDYSRGGSGTDA